MNQNTQVCFSECSGLHGSAPTGPCNVSEHPRSTTLLSASPLAHASLSSWAELDFPSEF